MSTIAVNAVYQKPQNRAFEHALWKFHVFVGLKHEKKTEKRD